MYSCEPIENKSGDSSARSQGACQRTEPGQGGVTSEFWGRACLASGITLTAIRNKTKSEKAL